MCVIAFSFAQPGAPALLMASNRDEFYSRPTLAAHWWDDTPGIFGGRDSLAGGSWLALSRRGRIAAVTNRRDGHPVPAPRSRGELVASFLDGDSGIADFARAVAARAGDYAGFNLLLFDFAAMPSAWYVNDEGTVRELAPGLYGLSNSRLDTPWPKVGRLKGGLLEGLSLSALARRDRLFRALLDDEPAGPCELPDTGLDRTRERYLSPVFIGSAQGPADPLGGYGTRASSVLSLEDGRLEFIERSWSVPGAPDAGYAERQEQLRFAG